MSIHTLETEWAGRPLRLETGRYARQANAAVVCQFGESAALATVGISPQPTTNNFLPLRVDFEEKMYAAGRIPGGFFRREGRPSDEAVLTARRIDRPVRPLLPSGLRNDLQIITTPIAAEHGASIDLVAMVAASAAMSLSAAPFAGPLGVVQIGRVDGEFVVNPSFEQVGEGDMLLLVAATAEGITMIEMQGQQVSNEAILSAMELGFAECQKVIGIIEQFVDEAGRREGDFSIWAPRPGIVDYVRDHAEKRIAEAIEISLKRDREQALRDITNEMADQLSDEYEAPDADIEGAIADIMSERLKAVVLEEERRLDGRAFDEVRPLSCEVGVFPRVHGSAVFQRGETQVMTITTLGATRDQRLVRTLDEENYERFMHHYNFPPYSVGEVRPLRSPGRREVGHGALAQKALEAVLPSDDDFPYTIRLVSECLESNGSTSMAAACGSTLSLMDAGVPIKAPVAGISIGLVYDGPDHYKLLTDIQGIEDFEGYMDFKVAGTRLGVTAIQMDTKTHGLPMKLMAEALEAALVARSHVLDVMAEAIPYPRTALSPFAPRMYTVHIDPQKIGLLIGPGGRMVRGLQEEYEVQIDIQDDGTVHVFGEDSEKVDAARQAIDDLTREVKVGEVFTGRVVSAMPFGAFVEILPGREGLVHISHLAWEHIGKTEDVAQVGDEMEVKVIEVDDEGKIRLSRKELLPKPEGYEERPREGRYDRRGPRGGRGGRDRR